jgi:hypothetical protein
MVSKKTEPLEQFVWDDSGFIEEIQEEYEVLIGRFIIEFSRLEYSLNQLIAQSIHDDADEPGYRFIIYFRMIDKIQYLKSYALRMIDLFGKDELVQKTKDLFQSLEKANSFRNRIVHANWCTLDKSFYVRSRIMENRTNGALELVKTKVDETTILNKIRELEKLDENLEELFHYEIVTLT